MIHPATDVGSVEGDTAIPVPETTTSVPVKNPFDDITTANQAATILGDGWDIFANVVSLNLTQSFVPSAAEGAGSEASKPAGTIALSGSVKRLGEADITVAMMNQFTGRPGGTGMGEMTWAEFIKDPSTNAAGTVTASYNLDGKEWGFVLVGDSTEYSYLVMVVRNSGRWQAVVRDGAGETNGTLHYHDTLTLQLASSNGYYTVDFSKLG